MFFNVGYAYHSHLFVYTVMMFQQMKHTCVYFQAVKKFMKLTCKCHGVSGACTIRTCWLAMQSFKRVGEYLRLKYNGATQVMINQDGSGLIVHDRNHKRPTRRDLVYLEESPDYCTTDIEIGTCMQQLLGEMSKQYLK